MPQPPSSRLSCRDHLLDSAEEVVLRTGLCSLTLDAVAAHARVSKGGLLYHFPSKDALILALVQRICDNWRADCTRAIEAEPPGPGRVPRALLKMCMGSTESCSENCRRSSIVLVAAMANNPALARPLRQTHDDLRARLRADGGSTAAGEVVVLAMNGMWFEQVFGLQEMPASRLDAIRSALFGLVEISSAGSGRRAAGGTPDRPGPRPAVAPRRNRKPGAGGQPRGRRGAKS